jgi:hypothetical protein
VPLSLLGTRENRGEPYGDPRRDPRLPRRWLERGELLPTRDMQFAPSWQAAGAALASCDAVPLGKPLASAGDGHAIIAGLARGDSGMLDRLGIADLPPGFHAAGRQWALVQGRDAFAIYAARYYGDVTLPGNVRVVAHNHPGPTPDAELRPHQVLARDLDVPPEGASFDDLLAHPAIKQTGIVPSAPDIHAISDGAAHVIYTRFVHRGGRRIANPRRAEVGNRIAIHMAGAHVIRFSRRTNEYWYQVGVQLRDATNELLWRGEMYAHTALLGEQPIATMYPCRPNALNAPPPPGWEPCS